MAPPDMGFAGPLVFLVVWCMCTLVGKGFLPAFFRMACSFLRVALRS